MREHGVEFSCLQRILAYILHANSLPLRKYNPYVFNWSVYVVWHSAYYTSLYEAYDVVKIIGIIQFL